MSSHVDFLLGIGDFLSLKDESLLLATCVALHCCAGTDATTSASLLSLVCLPLAVCYALRLPFVNNPKPAPQGSE